MDWYCTRPGRGESHALRADCLGIAARVTSADTGDRRHVARHSIFRKITASHLDVVERQPAGMIC